MPHGICPHSLISQSCTTMSVEQVRCIALEESRHSLTKESTRAFKDAQCARLVACKAPRTCASLNVPDLLLQAAVPWPARHSPRHSRYQTQIREPNMQAATRSGPMLCRVHGLHWHADASPMACALACCRRAAHPALCCIDHPYASPAQAGLCHGAASMEEQPPRLTTTSTVSKASVTNECAWPTTSTLACGRPRSTAATRAQPSPSSCCSTCGTRRAGRQGGSRRRAVRGVRQCGSP